MIVMWDFKYIDRNLNEYKTIEKLWRDLAYNTPAEFYLELDDLSYLEKLANQLINNLHVHANIDVTFNNVNRGYNYTESSITDDVKPFRVVFNVTR